MSEGRRFRGKPPHGSQEPGEPSDPPKMKDGEFYDVDPPINITSGTYWRIQCKLRFPPDHSRPDTYMVSGIPEGGREVRCFLLEFTEEGVRVTPAAKQEFSSPFSTAPPPKPKVTN